MLKIFLIILFTCLTICSFSQQQSFERFLTDSSVIHASVSLCLVDAETREVVMEHDSKKSLIPASVMKLITTAAAIELLGPQYTFKTIIGYTGSINKRSGKLTGDIVIRGGGDPALGSKYFSDHYQDFIHRWILEIKKSGIKKIKGKILTDDSHFDFQPIPSKWLWEDTGNYYGAGVYGLSAYDNTYDIHLKSSSDSTRITITGIVPGECNYDLSNWLIATGTSDKGIVFATPYSTKGWLAGSIPVNSDDFVLKASVTDPPLLVAKMLDNKLKSAGISISENPATLRSQHLNPVGNIVTITETISPPLSDIIITLNHESVNLFAEHLIKELGSVFRNSGSTSAGTEVIKTFLQDAGLKTDGLFIEDGSGLSPLNAINSEALVRLLSYMKNRGKYFPEYYSSLPEAGKEGTLKYYFRDPVFDSVLKAKSGSMTRVRSYAGYFKTKSGKNMIFCIIVNNYSGTSKSIISFIEEIIKEIILYR